VGSLENGPTDNSVYNAIQHDGVFGSVNVRSKDGGYKRQINLSRGTRKINNEKKQ